MSQARTEAGRHEQKRAAAAERLRQLGFPTIQLRTDGLADLHRATGLLGRATGREAEAGRVLGVMDSLLALLDRRRDPGPRPSVLVLAWDQPALRHSGYRPELLAGGDKARRLREAHGAAADPGRGRPG